MDSFFSRYRSLLVLLAVLLVQALLLATQMRRKDYPSRADGHRVQFVRGTTAYTITPVENVLVRSGHAIREAWHSYIDLRHVRQHDKDLQYQIDQLRLREAALAEDARQGQRLQRLLAFKQQYVGTTVAAQVVGTGGGDQGRILTIDKGREEGLLPDMAVITPDGIVGKLRDVFAHSAQVLLINDPSSGVGVILVDTRSRGVLRGSSSGNVLINTLLPDERIKAGEQVITSGGDRVFPRGLPVGVVKSAGLDPDHQPYALITIRTAANLDRLEEVLVVTDVAQQIARAAQTASADDEEGSRRASEVVAERLPSLHTANADAAAAGQPKPAGASPAAQPGAVLPHPLPTLHSDHFTPGTIPPATELRPGAAHTAAEPQGGTEPPRTSPRAPSRPNTRPPDASRPADATDPAPAAGNPPPQEAPKP